MRKWNKIVFIFSSAFLFAWNANAQNPHPDIKQTRDSASLLGLRVSAESHHLDVRKRTRDKAKQAFEFCRKRGYNSQYCILIDMGLPSGVKRFVLWDFRKNDTLITGLVSHGCGDMPWDGVWSKDKPTFSNRDGSHCTALGKYRIDDRAYSAWGVHVKYYLAGLDATNSNASRREIVFHSWPEVPEAEVYPNGTPEGWGCPAISDNTMKTVDPLVHKQKRHVLLWIYN